MPLASDQGIKEGDPDLIHPGFASFFHRGGNIAGHVFRICITGIDLEIILKGGLSTIRWGVAGNIVLAWIFTISVSLVMAFIFYKLLFLFYLA